jgi:fructan beta-fructosidase
MSIPREAGLRQTAEGIRLVQKPAREMESLRGQHFKFKGGDLAEANAWLMKNHLQGNQLEFEVEFNPGSTGVEGIKLLKGAGEETVIGVDRDHGTVFVDRTHSGNVSFNPVFSSKYEAPLAARDAKVKLHIFVDACSVEVFVNDGEKVFTLLVYPSAGSRGVEFFGPEMGAKIVALNIWNLKSSWK